MEQRKKVRRGAVQAKQPGTKLYTPRRDETAFAYDPETGEKRTEPVYTSAPADEKPRRELRFASRVALIVCAFIFSGMLLFTLSGYEKISRAYSSVNTLEDDIDEIKLRINALEAEIECAVTIDEATAYAVSHGMQYPLRAQYRQIVPGQAATGISPVNPIGGTVTPIDGPSGSFPGDGAPVQPLPEEPAPQEDGAIDLQIVEDPA